MIKSAVIDATGKYRYELIRAWAEGPQLGWIMLNPSTADASQDDPTIRRCISFSRAWGFGSLRVVNLFAYRNTYPADLWRLPKDQRIGEENDDAIRRARRACEHLVAAWGAFPQASDRVTQMIQSCRLQRLWCLGETKDRHPRHPLYAAGHLWPRVFIDQRIRR